MSPEIIVVYIVVDSRIAIALEYSLVVCVDSIGILSVVSIDLLDPVVEPVGKTDVLMVVMNVEVSVLSIDVDVTVKPQSIHVRVDDKVEVSVLVLMFQYVNDLALDDELLYDVRYRDPDKYFEDTEEITLLVTEIDIGISTTSVAVPPIEAEIISVLVTEPEYVMVVVIVGVGTSIIIVSVPSTILVKVDT